MSENGDKPRGKAHAKVEPPPKVGGMSPETVTFLNRRSLAFADATSKAPGKRHTYGTGKPEK
jgi:hypothetical protein